MTAPATSLYASLLGFLVLYLAYRIVGLRRSRKVGLGSGGDAQLEHAMRVLGNAIEYVPIALILIGLLEINGTPRWLVHALGGTLVLARLYHAQGFGGSTGTSRGKILRHGADLAGHCSGGACQPRALLYLGHLIGRRMRSVCQRAGPRRAKEERLEDTKIQRVRHTVGVEIGVRHAVGEKGLPELAEVDRVDDIVVVQVRIAGVAVAVAVGVDLACVRKQRAIVDRVADAVGVRVGCRGALPAHAAHDNIIDVPAVVGDGEVAVEAEAHACRRGACDRLEARAKRR